MKMKDSPATAAPKQPPSKPDVAAKPRNWRRQITLPGVLWNAVQRRWEEFHYDSFSPYAVELVCFDLRTRREHTVTFAFSQETEIVQDAIDRELIRHYRPNSPRNGPLVQLLNQVADDAREAATSAGPGLVAAAGRYVFFPVKLREIIEIRWRELGYQNISAYVTSLVRYDLMLSGPHRYFNGADADPVLLASLDQGTFMQFHSRRGRKILLDYLIEQAAGRRLTREETEGVMRALSGKFKERAVRETARERRRG